MLQKEIKALRAVLQANSPCTTIAVGDTYNETLLRDIAEGSRGDSFHLHSMTDFSQVVDRQIATMAQESITDVQLSANLATGVRICAASRMVPTYCDMQVEDTIRLGNSLDGTPNVFLFELDVSDVAYPVGVTNLARLHLSRSSAGIHSGLRKQHNCSWTHATTYGAS